jgi:hypothetical protein
MGFVLVYQETTGFPLHNNDWLVFIIQKESVYCAVQPECLNTFQGSLGFSRFIEHFIACL